MNAEYEATYHATEGQHWWFRARRNIVRALVQNFSPSFKSAVLEIGCSSGVLIQELEQLGYQNVIGIDVSNEAIESCHRRGIRNVRLMDAQRLDFPDASFDVITASDVLEHLSDDRGALKDWFRVLKPGGVLIVFVPAFPSLWSEHDVLNHHQRRYRMTELKEKVAQSGFMIERHSFWNSALLLPIAAVRAAKKIARTRGGTSSSDLYPPAPFANWLLFRILNAENALFRRRVDFWFGLSAMVVARKPV